MISTTHPQTIFKNASNGRVEHVEAGNSSCTFHIGQVGADACLDDNDVPESLLLEPNDTAAAEPIDENDTKLHQQSTINRNSENIRPRRTDDGDAPHSASRPYRSLQLPFSQTITKANAALWRWVNVSNLDNFIQDVYDYFEGGGFWCILCANALWLLYVSIPHSHYSFAYMLTRLIKQRNAFRNSTTVLFNTVC